MKFRIVAVGKIKEDYFRAAVDEYVKRLSRFAATEIVEVDECLFRGTPNQKEIDKILQTEGKSILARCEGCVVLLDTKGKQLDSVQLSEEISRRKLTASTFTFVIGGSNGLSDEVRARADMSLCFGKITLPHQLCRVVLVEQLYRVCCIANNIPYHK